MPIELTKPIEVPAAEAVSYPNLWFTQVIITARNPNADATVDARATPYRVLPDGAKELLSGESRLRLYLDGLFAASEFNPQQVAALGKMLAEATTAQKLGLAQLAMFAALEAKGKELEVF